MQNDDSPRLVLYEEMMGLLCLSSGEEAAGLVQPGKTVVIKARAQLPFRPDTIEITDPECWLVNELAIGEGESEPPKVHKSFLMSSTPVSGKFFAHREVNFGALMMTTWIVMSVRNVSPYPLIFQALFEGKAIQ